MQGKHVQNKETQNVKPGNKDGLVTEEGQRKCWRIQASYTVEASYIMSIVILSLAVLIRAAYGQYRDKTSLFLMNYAVERLYGQEDKRNESLQYGSASGSAERTKTQVTGTIRYQDRVRSIQKRVHEPEEALWMMTIFQKSEEAESHGGQLPQRNEEELSDD